MRPKHKITSNELTALIAWADESERAGGTTAWGIRFDNAMSAARAIRDRWDAECETHWSAAIGVDGQLAVDLEQVEEGD